jgi:pectate lyase
MRIAKPRKVASQTRQVSPTIVLPLATLVAFAAFGALHGCSTSDGNGSGTGGSTGAGGQTPAGTGGAAAGTGGAAAGTGGRGSGGATGIGGSGTGGSAGRAGTGGTPGTGGAPGVGGATGTGGGAANCVTPPDPSPLIGWASVTDNRVPVMNGGGSAMARPVTTLAALNAAAAGNTPAVIYVQGVLAPGKVVIGSNKTIVGLCGAEVHGHVDVSNVSNVIIRNLKIVGYGVGNCALDPSFDATVGCSSGDDAMTIQNNSHHIWVDHCDISDGTDGNLDTTSGSDFVTISWTKFHYTPRTDTGGSDSTGASGHRFSNLIGSGDNVTTDIGKLNVTWHHDWWADNVNQRMPRTRFGQIHVFNNLYSSAGDSYCTNSGIMTHVLVENNVYTNVHNPLSPDANGDMLARGNLFQMTTGTTTSTGVGFVPTYQYTLDATGTLAATIMAQAGPH